MLKVRTLFSGIGSPEKALKDLQIPYELIDFCEVDKYAVKSYCAVHGVSEDKNLGDITKVWGRNLPYADLLVWGFPCQDISVAGKQRGLKEGETRSGLYYEGFRILKETKPKYSIIENVKNLVGKKFKADFESMLNDIESLGYNNYWKVLNAKDYGIPQNRERVFIVSIRKDIDTGTFSFPFGFDNGLRLKDFLEDEVDEKYYISQEKTEKLISQLKNGKIPKLNTNPSGGGLEPKILQESPVPELVGGIGKINFGKQYRQGNRVYSSKKTAMCLMAQPVGNAGGFSYLYNVGYRIRKLTPKECWRLMGFKDNDFQKAKDAGVSNSQLYKQAGNSMVTNCLFYIFKNLLQAETATIYEENKELS